MPGRRHKKQRHDNQNYIQTMLANSLNVSAAVKVDASLPQQFQAASKPIIKHGSDAENAFSMYIKFAEDSNRIMKNMFSAFTIGEMLHFFPLVKLPHAACTATLDCSNCTSSNRVWAEAMNANPHPPHTLHFCSRQSSCPKHKTYLR